MTLALLNFYPVSRAGRFIRNFGLCKYLVRVFFFFHWHISAFHRLGFRETV